MKTRAAALLGWLLLAPAVASLRCEPPATPSPRQTVHTLGAALAPRPVRLDYLLFLPTGYARDPAARWPLILYLHGGSLRGADPERLRTLGLPYRLEAEPDFPFVVVSPQCPAGEIWSDAPAIDALLDHVLHEQRIDPARVYVTGHSMGGRGALYLAWRLPGRFAAVLALSPYSPVDAWAAGLARVPLWMWQGAADTLAPAADTAGLVRGIEAAGGHPRYTVLEGRDHFILDVYDRPEIYEWLARQRRAPDGGND